MQIKLLYIFQTVYHTCVAKGVDFIIGLGHSGFKVDKQIAKEVDGIDLVVGGHSNTFLYTGSPPSNEVPEGIYPTVIKRGDQDVPVVQAFKYSKYLGYLHVEVSNDGEITSYSGNPILLDSSYDQGKLQSSYYIYNGTKVQSKQANLYHCLSMQ